MITYSAYRIYEFLTRTNSTMRWLSSNMYRKATDNHRKWIELGSLKDFDNEELCLLLYFFRRLHILTPHRIGHSGAGFTALEALERMIVAWDLNLFKKQEKLLRQQIKAGTLDLDKFEYPWRDRTLPQDPS